MDEKYSPSPEEQGIIDSHLEANSEMKYGSFLREESFSKADSCEQKSRDLLAMVEEYNLSPRVKSFIESLPYVFLNGIPPQPDKREEVANKLEGLDEYIRSEMPEDRAKTALACLAKTCWASLYPELYQSKVKPEDEAHEVLVANKIFPGTVPPYLVDYLEKHRVPPGKFSEQPRVDFEGIIQLCPRYSPDYEQLMIILAELLTNSELTPDSSEVVFDLNNLDYLCSYHGFEIRNLEQVLRDGLKSDYTLSQENNRPVDQNTAFPHSVSLSRGKLTSNSAVCMYGPVADSHKIAAIIDPKFILPRSFISTEVYHNYCKTYLDECQSIDEQIPAPAICGLVCHPSMSDKVIEILNSIGSRIKLYDTNGNLIYPETESREEISTQFNNGYLKAITSFEI